MDKTLMANGMTQSSLNGYKKTIYFLVMLFSFNCLHAQYVRPDIIDTLMQPYTTDTSYEIHHIYVLHSDTFKIIFHYYDSSFKKLKEIQSLKNNLPHGTSVAYYKNGNKKYQYTCKNGWLKTSYYYDESGQLGYFNKMGWRKKGKGISYYDNGIISAKTIEKDMRTGFAYIVKGKWYYLNGKVSFKRKTVRKHKAGRELSIDKIMEFYPNGKKTLKGFMGYYYSKIVPVKKWKYWNEKGKLQKIKYYDKFGNLIKEVNVKQKNTIFSPTK